MVSMRRFWLIFAQAVTVSLAILFVVTTLRPDLLRLSGPGAAISAPVSYAPAVARAAPSVVNVYTRKHVRPREQPRLEDPSRPQFPAHMPGFSLPDASTSLGSGVVADAHGHVLTNYHVVAMADEIEVATADGRSALAQVVGVDAESDLAVLRVELPGLPVLAFPDPQVAAVRVGDIVLAIGNPFGVGQTTTQGIVSALGRSGLGINTYENFIQTDAAVNPGNSGGALIDAEGRLVGINTAIYSRTGGSLGISFAIPALVAQKVMHDIIEHGAVRRGWLGIEPQDMTADLARRLGLARPSGVVVAGILRDGPAAQAGLQVGDVVMALSGTPIRDTVQLLNGIAALIPGEPVVLTLLRDGAEQAVSVTPGLRPVQPGR